MRAAATRIAWSARGKAGAVRGMRKLSRIGFKLALAGLQWYQTSDNTAGLQCHTRTSARARHSAGTECDRTSPFFLS